MTAPRFYQLVLILAILLPSTTRAQASSDSAAVARTVSAFHTALAQGDSATVLALLAPDVVILESGGIETREEYRAHHLPADIKFTRSVVGTAGPTRVLVAGEVAWATSTSRVVGRFEGRQVDSQGAELVVLSRASAGWRIRAIHWSSRSRRGAE